MFLYDKKNNTKSHYFTIKFHIKSTVRNGGENQAVNRVFNYIVAVAKNSMEKTVVILCLITTEMPAIYRHPLICICFSEPPLCLASLKTRLSNTEDRDRDCVCWHSYLYISAAVISLIVNCDMEAKISAVESEIAAIKYLLSDRSVGDSENQYIRVYERFTMDKLQTTMDNLQTKENNLQTEKNLLLQQQLAATQTSAGMLSPNLFQFD
jgi:hypothetical protein